MAPHGKDSRSSECNTRMSIRMVALELYRVMKEIEELERKISSSKTGLQEKEAIEKRLRNARSERDRLKKMMEGAKGD